MTPDQDTPVPPPRAIPLTPLQAREIVARQMAHEHYLAAILHGAGVQGAVQGVTDTPAGPALLVQLESHG